MGLEWEYFSDRFWVSALLYRRIVRRLLASAAFIAKETMR